MPYGMTDEAFHKLPVKERERLIRADRPKIGILVKWGRPPSSGSGNLTSKCGRFEIEGMPEGTTRNQSYNLYDNKDGHKRVSNSGTIRQCKVEAERIAGKDQPGGEPEPIKKDGKRWCPECGSRVVEDSGTWRCTVCVWLFVKRPEPLFNLTRWCCTSGLCIDCHDRRKKGEAPESPLLAARHRVIQCHNLTKDRAEQAQKNWSLLNFEPKIEAVKS